MNTDVTALLDFYEIKYEIRPHSRAVFTCEEAAQERGVRLTQIVKCMIGQDPRRQLHVMLIPGDKKLKIKRVRQIAGGLAIELLPPEALARDFGLTVGAIAPTQLIGRAKQFYADNTLFREERIDISSGDPNAGLELRLEDLVRLVNAIRCDIISISDSGENAAGPPKTKNFSVR